MSILFLELSQDLNGNSQASATRQKMAQLEQMLSALDQLRRVRVNTVSLYILLQETKLEMGICISIHKTLNKSASDIDLAQWYIRGKV